MSRLLRLYPRAWRERYGDEFRALLDERPPSLADRLDIVRGALDAHRHPQLATADRDPLAWAPFAGTVTLGLTVLVVAASPEVTDEYGTYREAGGGMLVFLISFVLLALGYAAGFARLPSRARAGRAAAVVGAGCALLLALQPWLIHVVAVFAAATVVLAVEGVRYGWNRLPSVALALTATFAASAIAVQLGQPWWVNRMLEPQVAAAVLAAVAATWPLLGLALAGVPVVRVPGRADGTAPTPLPAEVAP